MRFASLGSGSRGNGTLVEADDACLLVDCGFSYAQLTRRLARLGRSPGDLCAVLLTHEHGDHVAGVATLAARTGTPVWLTAGTRVACELSGDVETRLFSAHEAFQIHGLEVRPFPVPHDAREPAQFVFDDGRRQLGVLTDAGSVTRHMLTMLSRCDALVLECNHDAAMLAAGTYPPALKRRVGGDWGHLSNAQAAQLLTRLERGRLQHVVAAHLSEKNNRPSCVHAALAPVVDSVGGLVHVATQAEGFAWLEIT